MAERYQRTQETDGKLRIASQMLQAERPQARAPVETSDSREVESDARLLAGLDKHRQATADALRDSEGGAISNPIFLSAATVPLSPQTPTRERKGWFWRKD